MNDRDFMRRAIELSQTGMRANAGGPFGAVIVKDGAIIGEGHNCVTAHAEIVAIRDAAAKAGHLSLEGAVIYTSCEPCPMCLGAIYWAGLDRIYYGNAAEDAANIGFDDALIYREIALPKAERALRAEQCLHEEALAAFQEWMEKSDRQPY